LWQVRPGLTGTFTAKLAYDIAPIPVEIEPTTFTVP